MKSKLLSLEKRQWMGVAIATIVSLLLVITIASAVTTISANIVTGGTLSVTGTSTFDGNLILVADTDLTFTGGTGTNEIALTDSLADALSIKRGSTDMMVFDSSTPRITFTPVVTLTGATTFNGNLILPANTDLTFTGTTGTNDINLTDSVADALSIVRGSTDFMVFDTNTPLLTITPATTITGTLTADGALVANGNVTLGNAGSDTITLTGTLIETVSAGVTAHVGSAQGNGAIAVGVGLVEISISANAGDAVTLPTAVAGLHVVIINHGVNAVDVFPATNDKVNEGSVNVALSLAADETLDCWAYDAEYWECPAMIR